MKVKGSRLYIAAIVVGLFAGAICLAFRYTVNWIAHLRPILFNHDNPIFSHIAVFTTIYLGLLLVGWLIKSFPKISGSGLPQTQALMFGRRVYNKPFTYLLVKYIGGILSLGSGLSLGREGTSVQMGSLTGYLAGKLMRVRKGKRRHLLAAGAGAGISAAFTAPLSSSILIMESLQKVTITSTLICTLLAGAVAGIMAKLIMPGNIYNNIAVAIPQNKEWQLIILFFIMAVFFALLGKLFSVMLLKGKTWYARWEAHLAQKNKRSAIFKQTFVLATVTWLVGLFFPGMIGGDQAFLVKESAIDTFIHLGPHINPVLAVWLNFAILLLVILIISSFTILSHSSGYPGGIFLPMMTVGGLSGKLFYDILQFCTGGELVAGNLSGYFILIGMSAFFIAVVRTPITGFILISEMTGHYETFFPTLIVGILVYYFTQILRVVPMNDLLYNFMIKNATDQPPRTTIYLDVEADSYFEGKTVDMIQLPKGSIITEVIRNRQEVPLQSNLILQENDQIGVEVNSNEIEQIYQALISLSA